MEEAQSEFDYQPLASVSASSFNFKTMHGTQMFTHVLYNHPLKHPYAQSMQHIPPTDMPILHQTTVQGGPLQWFVSVQWCLVALLWCIGLKSEAAVSPRAPWKGIIIDPLFLMMMVTTMMR